MFEEDTRTSGLIRDLKSIKCLRDGQLEYSVCSNGSLKVSGFLYARCRTIVDISQNYGKSTAVRVNPLGNGVELEFADDNNWKVESGVDTKQGQIPEDVVSFLAANMPTTSPTELPRKLSGATRCIRCTITDQACLTSDIIRNLLATPTVIDVIMYNTYFDVMVARKSIVMGGLSYIGTTTGFRAVRRVTRKHLAGKRRRNKSNGALAKSNYFFSRLFSW